MNQTTKPATTANWLVISPEGASVTYACRADALAAQARAAKGGYAFRVAPEGPLAHLDADERHAVLFDGWV